MTLPVVSTSVKTSLLGYNAEFCYLLRAALLLAFSFDSEDVDAIFFWNFRLY
jgi:hypothetical protein